MTNVATPKQKNNADLSNKDCLHICWRAKGCPIGFYATAVYSRLLAQLAWGKGKPSGLSGKEITDYLGIHFNTLTDALAQLEAHGLVENRGKAVEGGMETGGEPVENEHPTITPTKGRRTKEGNWFALEPPPDYFVKKTKGQIGNWWDRIAYWRVYLSETLTLKEAITYWVARRRPGQAASWYALTLGVERKLVYRLKRKKITDADWRNRYRDEKQPKIAKPTTNNPERVRLALSFSSAAIQKVYGWTSDNSGEAESGQAPFQAVASFAEALMTQLHYKQRDADSLWQSVVKALRCDEVRILTFLRDWQEVVKWAVPHAKYEVKAYIKTLSLDQAKRLMATQADDLILWTPYFGGVEEAE